jgi:hypothetical protein
MKDLLMMLGVLALARAVGGAILILVPAFALLYVAKEVLSD